MLRIVHRFPAAPHQQQQREDRQGDDHHQLKIVEIGDEHRLAIDFAVDQRQRRASRNAEALEQRRGRGRDIGGDGRREVGVRHLGHAHQLRADDRDSDRPADVARQVEQARRGGAQARLEGFERQALQRHENEAEAEALDDPAPDHRSRRLLEREAGHHPQGCAHQHHPETDQQPGIDLVAELARQKHRNQGPDPARRGQEARLEHRIAVKVLEQWREQREPGQQQHPGHRHEREPGGEIAVGEHAAFEQWILGGQRMDDEHPQGADRHPRLDDDLPALQPVLLLAAVEKHLQSADCQRQQDEAQGVELAAVNCGGRQITQQHQRAHNPDWQIDQEHPAPIVAVGQPPAEHRPEDRPDHDPAAEQRHRLAVFFARVDVEQSGLGKRDEERAADALDRAEGDHLRERGGHGSEHRSNGESDHRNQQQALSADAVGHPAADRQGDRRGDDVAGQHPVDGVLRRAQTGLHVRQSDVGDGRIEHLQEHRHHHRDGDENSLRRRQRMRDCARAFGHGPSARYRGRR